MDELNKSIDTLINELFTEPVVKSEALDIAKDSKTTADAALAAAPAMQDDASRGAGRPKEISDVPKNDQDGKRDGQYDSTIAQVIGEIENEEAKKQAKSIDQSSSAGRLAEAPKMKDPRAGGQVMSKSISEEEYAEFEAFKKAKTEQAEKAKQEELKKAEDLKKAEFENLIKSAITKAIEPVKQENEKLKKSLDESQALIKAMAGQPQRAKSVTGIDAIEKSKPENSGPQEFSKAEKLDAAEALVKAGKLPVDAVIELENTNTLFNPAWRKAIEAQLEKQS
jgi:hypothetical protein